MCDALDEADCTKIAHSDASPEDYPYEGMMTEIQGIESEITEVQQQRAELNRQLILLAKHREHVQRLIGLIG